MSEAAILPLALVGIVIIIAIFLSILAKKLGQNAAIGFILAGFILGPFGLQLLHPQDPVVIAFSELGLFILLFYLGLELSLKEFISAGKSGFGLALIDMVCSTVAGFAIAHFFGFSLMFSILAGFMLFSTSTAIVAKFAIDKGLMQRASTKLAISILILQDFLGILLVVLITSSASKGSAFDVALTSLVFAIAVFIAVQQLSKFIEGWMLGNNFGQTEITLYALGVGLVVATVASLLGLSTALGAYFAGFALAETQAGRKIKRDVNFMRDFFLVFFFVGFGTTIFFNPEISAQALPSLGFLASVGIVALLMALAAIAAHFLVFTVFGSRFGLNREDSTDSSILLVPLGEFVVIIATAALVVVQPSEKAVVPVLAFMLIIVTVFLFEPLYKARRFLERISRLIPSLSREVGHSRVEEHTPYSQRQFQSLAWNLFVIVCLAWLAVILYNQLPTFGVPIPYIRQLSSSLIFLFFAIAPLVHALIALKNLLKAHHHRDLSTV